MGEQKKKKATVALGASVIILTLIGLITVISFVAKTVGSVANQTAKKEEFAQFLLPLVMTDPVPFEGTENLDNALAIQVGIWNILLTADKSKYPVDDDRMLIIPASDVEVYAAKIFGKDLKLSHTTVGDAELSYQYDEDINSYHVPSSAQVGLYTPKVTQIKKSGDEILLTVGYVPPGSIWEGDLQGNVYKPDPDKYMIYVLKKNSSGYYVYAIREQEKASSVISSSSAASTEAASSQSAVSDVSEASSSSEDVVSEVSEAPQD